MSSGSLIDGCVGIDLSAPAEFVNVAGVFAAIRADIARREDPIGALRAYLSDERVSLLFESPMH